jgi:hypothetical protein
MGGEQMGDQFNAKSIPEPFQQHADLLFGW